MKKIYLLSFASIAMYNVFGQKATPSIVEKKSETRLVKTAKPKEQTQSKSLIWGSDFSDASQWVIAHDAADCSLDFAIGQVSCQGGAPIPDINSTTASNGWAMVDSDNYGGDTGGSEVEDSWLTTSQPIDLSAHPNVVVEFETFYRAYNYEKPYLVVGIGDGNGNVIWPTNLTPQSDLTTLTGVYDVFPERAYNQTLPNIENPRKVRINISDVAGGQSEVYIRFNWSGTWGYAWFIDDVQLLDQPANDLESSYAYFVGTNNEGIEYGRNPLDQLDVSYDLGGEVINFGLNAQTNVNVNADFGSFNYDFPIGSLASGDSAQYSATQIPTLAIGQYDGTYIVTSDGENSSGPDFYNNESRRSFAVTADVYSQDGLGVYPQEDLSVISMGSESFGEPTDTYLASMYHLKQQTNQISGFEILLSQSSVAGGALQIFVVDTAVFMNDIPNDPVTDLNTFGAISSIYDITAADITAGSVKVYFPQVVELSEGAYYAVVKTENNGSTPVRVLDDQTVGQPWYASMVNTLNTSGAPTSYSNGNAFAIRLLMGDQLGIANIEDNHGINVYPNPANASANISVDVANVSEVTISVTDLAGKVVYNNNLGTVKGTQNVTVNTEALNSGVYMVKVSVNDTISTQKLVIRK